jgi:hypothetical protein
VESFLRKPGPVEKRIIPAVDHPVVAVLRIISPFYIHIGPEILGKIMILKQELYALLVKNMQRRKEQGILPDKGVVYMDQVRRSAPMSLHGAEYFSGEAGSVFAGRNRSPAQAVIAEFFKLAIGKGKTLSPFPAYNQYLIPGLSKSAGLMTQYACYPAPV